MGIGLDRMEMLEVKRTASTRSFADKWFGGAREQAIDTMVQLHMRDNTFKARRRDLVPEARQIEELTVKASSKPKTATERDAAEFLRAVQRLLKTFNDSPPKVDEGYAHVSTMRTFTRVVRGIEEAKTDLELAAAMRFAIDLPQGLEIVRLAETEKREYFASQAARAQDLEELIEELESIRTRERE
jgi:hypothetical protein